MCGCVGVWVVEGGGEGHVCVLSTQLRYRILPSCDDAAQQPAIDAIRSEVHVVA